MWLYLRIVLILFSFIGGALSIIGDVDADLPFFPLSVYIVVVLFFVPIAMFFILLLQKLNPYTGETWTRPNWHRNFLTFSDPVNFFYLGGFVIAAGGLGNILSFVIFQRKFNEIGILEVVGGISVLLGIELFSRIFKGKFKEKS